MAFESIKSQNRLIRKITRQRFKKPEQTVGGHQVHSHNGVSAEFIEHRPSATDYGPLATDFFLSAKTKS